MAHIAQEGLFPAAANDDRDVDVIANRTSSEKRALAVIRVAIGAMFVFAMLALIASLLLFLREIFLAVSTPRHVPR